MINKNLMELKKILLSGSKEGWNLRELDIDTFKKYINTDFSDSWNQYIKGNFIYRGERDITSNINYIIPGKRYSQNTSNYYTELFSNILPSWKDFPKRNHSIICSTDYNKAVLYFDNSADFIGCVLVILPKNGTKIGVCPKDDIWFSFQDTFKSLFEKYKYQWEDEFNLGTLFNQAISRIALAHNYDYDIYDVLSNFGNAEEINRSYTSSKGNLYMILFENRKNITKFLDTIFNPNKNGFKLLTINNKILRNKEIWFDNDCIAIEYRYLKNIIKTLDTDK
jgi:hypothetical protein